MSLPQRSEISYGLRNQPLLRPSESKTVLIREEISWQRPSLSVSGLPGDEAVPTERGAAVARARPRQMT